MRLETRPKEELGSRSGDSSVWLKLLVRFQAPGLGHSNCNVEMTSKTQPVTLIRNCRITPKQWEGKLRGVRKLYRGWASAIVWFRYSPQEDQPPAPKWSDFKRRLVPEDLPDAFGGEPLYFDILQKDMYKIGVELHELKTRSTMRAADRKATEGYRFK